ncbi:hypothetical protein L7F22_066482 [Adiantum nelumboides]|nr:hypothetical protein [Adiantum nelumboides]
MDNATTTTATAARGLEGAGVPLPVNFHGNLRSAESDDHYKDLLQQAKESKQTAVVSYGAKWSASSSITIGGHVGRTFQLSRSVRQGCPLAPYLFLFVAETMSDFIRAQQPILRGLLMSVANEPDLIDQEYADDTLLFLHYSPDVLGMIRYALEVGQDVTPEQQFSPVMQSMRRKLCYWSSQHLSLASRALVANQVLLASAWYVAFMLNIARRGHAAVETVDQELPIRGFSTRARARWSTVIMPTSQGGLGIIDPQMESRALLTKLIVRGLFPGHEPWKMLLQSGLSTVTPTYGVRDGHIWTSGMRFMFTEGAAAQPIPILPPPSLPDPPASPVITPSTSHPVPPIQPPDVSPDHALSDSDSELDVADATPEVDAAPPRREKRIPGWLYSTMGSKKSAFQIGDSVGVGCRVKSCDIDGTITYSGYSTHVVTNVKWPTFRRSCPLLVARITAFSPRHHFGRVKSGTVIITLPGKETEAKELLGADEFFVSSDNSAMQRASSSLDYILDTVSAPHELEPYLDLLDLDGKLVFVGVPDNPFHFMQLH